MTAAPAEPNKVPTNFRSVRLIRVIECVTLEGAGTPDSPARQVTTYTDLDGNTLAVHDPIVEAAVS
jgi:hypothetical protein